MRGTRPWHTQAAGGREGSHQQRHPRDTPPSLARGAPCLFPTGTPDEPRVTGLGHTPGRGAACSRKRRREPGRRMLTRSRNAFNVTRDAAAPTPGCCSYSGGLGARTPFVAACQAIGLRPPGVGSSGPQPAGRVRPAGRPHTGHSLAPRPAQATPAAVPARAGRGGVTGSTPAKPEPVASLRLCTDRTCRPLSKEKASKVTTGH